MISRGGELVIDLFIWRSGDLGGSICRSISRSTSQDRSRDRSPDLYIDHLKIIARSPPHGHQIPRGRPGIGIGPAFFTSPQIRRLTLSASAMMPASSIVRTLLLRMRN